MNIITQETLENGDVKLILEQGSIIVPLINTVDNRDFATRLQYQINLIENNDNNVNNE